MAKPKTPMRQRLLARLIIDQGTGCLLWTGAVNHHGYGRIMLDDRRTRLIHRVMYEMFVGPIPAGLEIDHLCRVRHCASPAHLEAVTRRVNQLRGNTIAAANAAVTHCPAGHEYDLLNTYWTREGGRNCRACHREQERHRMARQRTPGGTLEDGLRLHMATVHRA